MSKKNVTISKIILYKGYGLLGRTFRMLFSAFFPKKLNPEKEVSDLNLLLFTGQKGAKMLKAALFSIYNSWEKVPMLTIVTDGTPIAIIQDQMGFWPYPYKVKTWEESAAFHQEKGRKSLIEFSQNSAYARKLLVVLAEAEMHPVLYCDTDILWFGEPRLPVRTNGFTMRISMDNEHCYHMPILRYLDRLNLLDKPPINSGIIYLSGSPYDHYKDFDQLMDMVKIFHEGFAEQTTFALMADRLGDTWTLDEVIISTRDLYWPLIPAYLSSGKQFARHHVMTKHSWFWRDALYLLLFKGKTRRQAVTEQKVPG
ncbi:hypothetical protein ACX0G9_16875 [Flavitalea flava]